MNKINYWLDHIRYMWGLHKGTIIVFSNNIVIPIGYDLPCGYPLNDNEAAK